MAEQVKLAKITPGEIDQYMRKQAALEDIDRQLLQLARVVASKRYFPGKNAKIGLFGKNLSVEFFAGRQQHLVYVQLDQNDRVVDVLGRAGTKWWLHHIGAWMVSTSKDILQAAASGALNTFASHTDSASEEDVDIVSSYGVLHPEGKDTWDEAKDPN